MQIILIAIRSSFQVFQNIKIFLNFFFKIFLKDSFSACIKKQCIIERNKKGDDDYHRKFETESKLKKLKIPYRWSF